METKNRRLSIKLTEENYAKIHAKAKAAKKSLTDYITGLALGRQLVIISDLTEVLKQLRAIGGNLNQLTTLAHMGRVSVINLSETQAALAEISAKLTEILERRRWSA